MIALPLLLAAALAADAPPPSAVPAPGTPAPRQARSEPAKSDAARSDPAKAPNGGSKGGKKGAKAEALPPAAPPPAVPEVAPPAPAAGPAATADEGRLLVEHKCGKCHDVSIAFSSELSDASWKLHMKRMANRPGAAISDDQARKIHGFLKDNAARSASR